MNFLFLFLNLICFLNYNTVNATGENTIYYIPSLKGGVNIGKFYGKEWDPCDLYPLYKGEKTSSFWDFLTNVQYILEHGRLDNNKKYHIHGLIIKVMNIIEEDKYLPAFIRIKSSSTPIVYLFFLRKMPHYNSKKSFRQVVQYNLSIILSSMDPYNSFGLSTIPSGEESIEVYEDGTSLIKANPIKFDNGTAESSFKSLYTCNDDDCIGCSNGVLPDMFYFNINFLLDWSLIENAIYRLKNTFSGNIKSRSFENQITEITTKCSILNVFAQLGLPNSSIS